MLLLITSITIHNLYIVWLLLGVYAMASDHRHHRHHRLNIKCILRCDNVLWDKRNQGCLQCIHCCKQAVCRLNRRAKDRHGKEGKHLCSWSKISVRIPFIMRLRVVFKHYYFSLKFVWFSLYNISDVMDEIANVRVYHDMIW